MRKGLFALSALSCAAWVAGVSLAGSPGVAKAAVARHRQEEEVTVKAPRAKQRLVGRTYSGINIMAYSLTRHVSRADLDLTRYADVAQLRRRIRTTAEEACAELAHEYPLVEHSGSACVRQAVEDAMTQARRAIAAAGQ